MSFTTILSKKSHFYVLLFSLLPGVLLLYPEKLSLLYHPTFFDFMNVAPYFVFLLGGFLAIQLHQLKIALISVLMMTSYFFLSFDFSSTPLSITLIKKAQVLSVTIPFSSILLLGLSEGKLFSKNGLLGLLLIFVPLSLFIADLKNKSSIIQSSYLVPIFPYLSRWNLPQISLVLVAIYILFILMLQTKRLRDTYFCLLIGLIPLFALFEWVFDWSFYYSEILEQKGIQFIHFQSIIYFTLSLILFYGVVRLYWAKIYIDELTEIPNRRSFNENLDRLGSQYIIAMIDIDHFKRFNDNYGHEQGDHVLRLVASHLDSKTHSKAFRYGGEEFCVILEKKSQKEATKLLEKTRSELAERYFALRKSENLRKKTSKKDRGKAQSSPKKIQITISIGVSQKTKSSPKSPKEVLKKADEALYLAKKKGRNQTVWMT